MQTQLHQVHVYHCEQASTDSLDSAEEFHPVQINLGEVSLSICHRMMMMVAVMIIRMLVQLATSSLAQNGGAIFSAVCGPK